MSLLTLSILAVVCTILFIIGCFLDYDEYTMAKACCIVFGIFGMLIVGAVGFGAYASNSTQTMKIEPIYPDTVIKSKTTVYVEIKGETTLEFTSKKDYDEINDSTEFYRITYFNHYGSVSKSKITNDSKYRNCIFGEILENNE